MSINSLNANLANVAKGTPNQGPRHLVPQPGQDKETFINDQFERGNIDIDAADLALCVSRGVKPGTTVHVVTGTEGNDKIGIKQGLFGGLTVDVNGEKFKIEKEDVDGLVIAGLGGDDQIVADKSVKRSLSISGGEGDDYIVGGRGGDILGGGAGNDLIEAGGRLRVNGRGVPTDQIFGADGDDRLIGGGNRSIIYGGAGDDYIFAGNNLPSGLLGAIDSRAAYVMKAYGEEGNDEIIGSKYEDYLNGGPGTDTLIGGTSNDHFVDPDGAITDHDDPRTRERFKNGEITHN